MKRTMVFALMIPLLLTGCVSPRQDENEWKTWTASLSRAEEIAFTAEIVSRGGGGEIAFTADVTRKGGRTALTVTAPETIRGVTAAAEDGKKTLEYEGLILELDALGEDSLPPCSAGELLLRGIREGPLLWTGRSGEHRTGAFSLTDGETLTLWRGADGAPVYAEIARGESPELILRITNWHIKE